MTTHTPGPWKCVEEGEANQWALLSDTPNHWLISFLFNGDTMSAKQAANARLIAAAPELLAACEAMQEYIAQLWSDAPEDAPAFMFDAMDIIKKAKGELK